MNKALQISYGASLRCKQQLEVLFSKKINLSPTSGIAQFGICKMPTNLPRNCQA